jgi:Magnesium chelatase, subunit ChlI C-terminal
MSGGHGHDAVRRFDLVLPAASEGSAEVRARVAAARRIQMERLAALRHPRARTNADCDGNLLEEIAAPDQAGRTLLREAADALSLSARGYHRTLRVARTLADLDGEERVARIHIAEALSYRGETCVAPRPRRDDIPSVLPTVAGLSTYPHAVTQHSKWFANRTLMWPNQKLPRAKCDR